MPNSKKQNKRRNWKICAHQRDQRSTGGIREQDRVGKIDGLRQGSLPSTVVTWRGLTELQDVVKYIYDVLEEKRTMKYVVLQKKGKGATVVWESKTPTNFKEGKDYYMINLGRMQINIFWLVTFLRPLK